MAVLCLLCFAISLAGFSLYLFRRYMRGSIVLCHCATPSDYRPKIIITGANSGLGKATAFELAKRHCSIIMACRDLVGAERVRLEIVKATGNRDILVKPLDLSSSLSIRQFCKDLRASNLHANVLINNAGVYLTHYRLVQPLNIEEDMAVNYFGHFYLTHMLLTSNLMQSKPPHNVRIVVVSSSLACKARFNVDAVDFNDLNVYKPFIAYANSKLANCLFARELNLRYHKNVDMDDVGQCRRNGGDVNIYCISTDGMINTRLFRHHVRSLNSFLRPVARFLQWSLLKTSTEGCQSIVHCSISQKDDLPNQSGCFYSNCKVSDWPRHPLLDCSKTNTEFTSAFWDKSLLLMQEAEKKEISLSLY